MQQTMSQYLLNTYILSYWLFGCAYISYESQFPDPYWIHHVGNGHAYPYPLFSVILMNTIFSIIIICYYLIIRSVTVYNFWFKQVLAASCYLLIMAIILFMFLPMHTPSYLSATMLVLITASLLQLLLTPVLFVTVRAASMR